ncbi:sensor histidine kinase [Paenibacillus sp. PAMC21692]|uniref:cache domain-containing sensor histidine kinase n=1 Tax=Paenibacillus sp. PAMC21692 TaxID=2762320 RepID=UPI00164E3095|nr:histidine kinase [Paenibacillus sp. PAMC21692]QNK57008.1 histidine kinase [Paenibacillus sp. PAMC21692]
MKINRMFSGSSLFKKLFFLLIVSVYIPLLLVGYMTYSKSSEQIEKMTSAFLSDNLGYNMSRIQDYLKEVESQSIDVYTSDKLQKLLEESNAGNIEEFEFINSLAILQHQLSDSYFLSVYPIDPGPYFNYNVLRANSPEKDIDWFEHALEQKGRGYWMNETGTDFDGVHSDFYYIRSIRSLRAPLFEDIGVMTIRVPGKQIREQLLLLDRYPNHRISIVDEQNRDLLFPRTTTSGTDTYAGLLEEDLLLGQQEFRVMHGEKEDYYAASMAIGSNGWKLVATIPTSDVKGPILQLRQFTWIVILISLSLIAILLAVITNSFTLPIKAVVSSMKKMNLGLLEYCTSYTRRKDEIGQLVSGYNVMIKGMHELLETTKSSEREKRKLELQMLMHQINPHLLYNTLDSIKWKAEVAGEASIARMSTLLADLLRFSLNNGEEMTTVEREIEHVKSYLMIELIRNNNGFQVMYNIHPTIWNMPYMKLTIQPIVENCVKHGMKKMAPGTGKVMIHMYPEGEDIVCAVEDNGPGCTDETFEALKQIQNDQLGARPTGIGLFNVSQRLKANFGQTYGLSFGRSGSSGLRVTIRQPALQPEDHNNPM